MPLRTPRTKSEKKAAVSTVMHEFGTGKLHSGSKEGLKVTNPKQAVAIALSESGQSKKSAPGKSEIVTTTQRNRTRKPANNVSRNTVFPTKAQLQADKNYDRSSHYPGNPGFPSSSEAGGSPPSATYQAHEQRERDVLGAGYDSHEQAEQHLGTGHQMHMPPARNADAFKGTNRSGPYRLSGVKGAHMLGKRK